MIKELENVAGLLWQAVKQASHGKMQMPMVALMFESDKDRMQFIYTLRQSITGAYLHGPFNLPEYTFELHGIKFYFGINPNAKKDSYKPYKEPHSFVMYEDIPNYKLPKVPKVPKKVRVGGKWLTAATFRDGKLKTADDPSTYLNTPKGKKQVSSNPIKKGEIEDIPF